MAAGFSVLTYIGPVLSQAGGYHGAMISIALLVFGIASVAGSTLGGQSPPACHRLHPYRCGASVVSADAQAGGLSAVPDLAGDDHQPQFQHC
jgi:predicted MFS family arabinose efflux permease